MSNIINIHEDPRDKSIAPRLHAMFLRFIEMYSMNHINILTYIDANEIPNPEATTLKAKAKIH